jgi:hypothetical protein
MEPIPRFPLEGQRANISTSRPVGPYGVRATYLGHEDGTTVEMTGNRQISLALAIDELRPWICLSLIFLGALGMASRGGMLLPGPRDMA